MATGSIQAGVFGSVAIPFGRLPMTEKWKVIYAGMSARGAPACATDGCAGRQALLARAVETARDQRFLDKLRTVNRAVNRIVEYGSDRNVYGAVDYWATPEETLARGRGDCEDYAILKMAALKAAGIPSRSMSIVVLRDRGRDLFHAVLAVSTDQGSFILDNVHDRVLPDREIQRYQPLYSLSQDRAWIHGVRRSTTPAIANNVSFDRIAPGEGAETLGRLEARNSRVASRPSTLSN